MLTIELKDGYFPDSNPSVFPEVSSLQSRRDSLPIQGSLGEIFLQFKVLCFHLSMALQIFTSVHPGFQHGLILREYES